jgi:excisionase family DNA binding protein
VPEPLLPMIIALEATMERLLTVSEVAQLLQVKPSTVYTWVREGKIPHTKIGRLIRFTLDQIKKIIGGK